MRSKSFAAFALLCAIFTSLAHADEVVFKNGDRLTGTIKSVDGGKLTIDTKVAGVVIVDMGDVQTFSTDAPVQLRLNDKTVMRDKINAQGVAATQPTTGPAQVAAGGKDVPVADIKRIMPK